RRPHTRRAGRTKNPLRIPRLASSRRFYIRLAVIFESPNGEVRQRDAAYFRPVPPYGHVRGQVEEGRAAMNTVRRSPPDARAERRYRTAGDAKAGMGGRPHQMMIHASTAILPDLSELADAQAES